MAFGAKLDIRLLSADLSPLVSEDSEEELKTKVKIVIDDVTVGFSALESGSLPEWGENFSISLDSTMRELRAEVHRQPHPQVPGQAVLAQCRAGLTELRCEAEASEEQTTNCTLELSPRGQIFLEITFHPRQATEPRKEKIKQEGNYLHRGHRYIRSSSFDLIKCAFCQVSAGVIFFLIHWKYFSPETDGGYF